MTAPKSTQCTTGYLASVNGPIFVSACMPGSGRARGVAVLCPPLFGEHVNASEVFRLLAEALCERGVAAVRFDYLGTGDSGGDIEEFEDLEALVRSTSCCLELARDIVDGPVVAVAMRAGALILDEALEHGATADAAVLWDPCTSGAQFVRSEQMMSAARGLVGVDQPAGSVELPGAKLTSTAASHLTGLRLDGLHFAEVAARTELAVLIRDERHRRQAVMALQPLRFAIETVAGQPELLDVDPLHRIIPTTGIARVVDIAAGFIGCGEGSAWRHPLLERSAVLGGSGTARIRERPIALGRLGLFGIEARPEPSAERALPGKVCDGTPTIVFLNAGNESHIGPCRLWVTLARQWAFTLGLRSIRIDLSGLGDSPTRPGQRRGVVRSPVAFDDVADISTALGADAGAVVLVGLCSGAYQGLEAGLQMELAGILAINPLFRFAPPEMADGGVDDRRRFLQGGPLVSYARRLPTPILRLASRAANRVVGVLGANEPAESLHELAAANVPCLCIGGPSELAPITGGTCEQLIDGTVIVEVVNGLDHGLVGSGDRGRIAERLTEQLRVWIDSGSFHSRAKAPLLVAKQNGYPDPSEGMGVALVGMPSATS